MALLPLKKKSAPPQEEKPLTPLEQRQQEVAASQKQVEEDTKRKLTIIKYRELLFANAKYIAIGLGIIVVVISGYFIIRAILREPPPPPPVVEEERPPDDFQIQSAEAQIVPSNGQQNLYDFYVRLINTDPNWGVSQLDYEITLLDAAGNQVGSRERSTYILPNQDRSLIELSIPTESPAVSSRITLDPVMVQKLKEFARPKVSVIDLELTEVNNKTRLTGNVVNESPFGFDQVDILITLLDANDQVVGLNYTNVNDLLSETKRFFAVSWNQTFPQNVRPVVTPAVNVYSADAFLDVYSSGQEFEY